MLTLHMLTTIDHAVNRAITYTPHTSWRAHNGRGNCKAFALAKYEALRMAGMDPADLRLVIVLTERGEGHALVEARVDGEWYALDSRTPDVLPINRLFTPHGYTLLSTMDETQTKMIEATP